MRQQVVKQGAVGSTNWLFVDPRRNNDFNVGLTTTIETAATLTYDVEITSDANSQERHQKVSISRSTTTATVTLVGHGLKTGDNVIVFDSNYTNHTPESNLEGRHDITVTTLNAFTYPVADTGATSAIARLISFSVSDHATIAASSAAESSSQTTPVSAFRLNVTAYTDGFVELTVLQQG